MKWLLKWCRRVCARVLFFGDIAEATVKHASVQEPKAAASVAVCQYAETFTCTITAIAACITLKVKSCYAIFGLPLD